MSRSIAAEKRETRPFTSPYAQSSAASNMGGTSADWSQLRIGSPPPNPRLATSQSMHAYQRDLLDETPSPGSIRPATRGGRSFEVDKSPSGLTRPATRSGMASQGRTARTYATSNATGNDLGFEFGQEEESILPAHFRLKASLNEQPRSRASNITIHLPEHAPASFMASKSLQFLARYKEASSSKYRVGSKSLRLQKILELLADIAVTQDVSCPALGSIHKDLSDEIFSSEFEGHDSKGVPIPMTWKALCSNTLNELEDVKSKLNFEQSQNEALLHKNQNLAAAVIDIEEKMQAAKEHNDLEALEQKARYDDVEKQRQKLEELAASQREMQAAFWSSDVSRRAYKAALVQDANIQMSTQQYVQKSDDAFQQLLTVHKETLAKAQEIQSDSYAKDELVTRLRNQMKELALNHTRQEGLLVVYQDRVNNSVAKTIYDALEHDLSQKNVSVIKLEEENAKLNAKVAALELELQLKSQKGRKDDSKLFKSMAEYKQQAAKSAPTINSKDQIVSLSGRPVEGGDSQDDVVIPNFFVDGLRRRPGRVGKLCLL